MLSDKLAWSADVFTFKIPVLLSAGLMILIKSVIAAFLFFLLF
jgi:hypothetical protein